MTDAAFPVKYVLYTHYFQGEVKDLAAYKAPGFTPDQLTGINELIGHFRGLSQLLNAPGHEGMMLIFYAAGYQRFLEALAATEDIDGLLRRAQDDGGVELCFGRDVAAYVGEKLRELGLAERVRFVTPLDLRVILGRVNKIFAANFRTFFVGRGKGIRYDAPKVVEAILRLRLIGTGVPVLRLDQDAIFRGVNKDIGDLGMFKAVACAVRAYQIRIEQPAISTFVFSGSYNSRALLQERKNVDRFEAWSRAFATRVYPALIATPKRLVEICGEPAAERAPLWNQYVVDAMKDDDADPLLRQFYGLAPLSEGLAVRTGEGITTLGAHPLQAVISGSLLCLSDGAIVDLPPFSNFSNNVMWIDDHIKYSLHRAMNHFPTSEPLRHHRGLSDARLDDVTVTKARPAPGDLPNYIFGSYLPTLFYGTIVDAWITTEPLLKFRSGGLTKQQKQRVLKARGKQHLAPLPKALLEALNAGTFENRDLTELRKTLTAAAVRRIEEVRQQWLQLKTAKRKTFACYWAEGKVGQTFGESCFAKDQPRLWEGITPKAGPVRTLDDLYDDLRKKVDDVIEDTIDYVKWTLAWPQFMQIVRSIRQGEFSGDLSWRPPAVKPAAAAATARRGRSRP